MELKIELLNFKSFKNIILEMSSDASLVAVVGLNGSGKSNLVDGVIYVLGEQRHGLLRIRRLRDLIHTGENSCMVKLTVGVQHVFQRQTTMLDNIYKYNDKVTTHEEYMRVIADVGVIKSTANFFVLQSSIQLVGQKKDKEMTAFLERVSGSVGYKRSHERQLQLQQENAEEVMRRRALKNNLNRRLRKAKAQISAGIDAAALRRQHEELRREFALFSAHQLQLRLTFAGGRLQHVNATIAALAPVLGAQELEANVAEPDDVVEAMRAVNDIDAKLKQASSNKQALQKQLDEASQQDEVLRQRIAALKKNVELGEGEMADLLKLKAAMETELDELDRVDELLARARPDYDAIKQRADAVQDGSVERVLRHKHAMALREQQLRARLERESNRVDDMQRKRGECALRVQSMREQAAGVEEFDVEDAGSSVSRPLERREDLLARRAALLERVCDLEVEDDDDAEQALMDMMQRLSGVRGTLSSLVRAKSMKMRSAVDSALPGRECCLVVDNPSTLWQCVGDSHAFDAAGARIEGYLINSAAAGEAGASALLANNIPDSKLLSDVLRINDAARPAVLHACDNIVVARDAETAQGNARALGCKTTVISENGTMRYEADGALVVEPRRATTKKCARAYAADLYKQMDAIGDEMCGNDADIADVCQRIEALVTRQALRHQEKMLLEMDSCLEDLQRARQRTDEELKHLLSIRDKVPLLGNEDIVDAWAQFCAKHGFAHLQEYEALVRRRREDVQKECEASLQAYVTRAEKEAANLTALDREFANLEVEYEGRATEGERLISELRQVDKEVEEMLTKKKTYAEMLEQWQRQSKAAQWDKVAKSRMELERAQDELAGAQRQMHTAKLAYEEHLDQCARKSIPVPLNEDDGSPDAEQLPLVLLRPLSVDEFDRKVQDYEAQIEGVQTALQGLGVVNENAAEEHAALSLEHMEATSAWKEALRRQAEIGEEVNQLHVARSQLLASLVRDLDNHLDATYKKLLDSPHACAKLMCLSVDEPYAHGTSFMCCPPGKRFSRIAELSAGQSSMAALALYFALRACRPSCLLLLDEVDACLDVSHRDNLVNYLEVHRAEGLQTIVSTHKAEVAACADEVVALVEMPNAAGDAEPRLVKLDLREFKTHETGE